MYTMKSLRNHAIHLIEPLTNLNVNRLCLNKLKGGINSAVYSITIDGKPLGVLKKYPDDPKRDRRANEAKFLKFLNIALPNKAPRLLDTLPSENISLLEWIEGKGNSELQVNDTDQFTEFQLAIDKFKSIDQAKQIDLAADSVLCPNDLITQMRSRLSQFYQIQLPEQVHYFLSKEFEPYLDSSIQNTIEIYKRLHIDIDERLSHQFQTLIASDLGTHNTIRRPNGRLVFIDFEFAGWDDPITAIANFTLHPGMKPGNKLRKPFVENLLHHFKYYPHIVERYHAMLPLFGLRWCLIMLNSLRQIPDISSTRLNNQNNYYDLEQFRKSILLFNKIKGINS